MTRAVVPERVKAAKWDRLLGRRVSMTFWVCSWALATLVFVGVVLWNGISPGDASFSTYSTWAIAHGNLACAYAPLKTAGILPIAAPITYIAPLYPTISGLGAAIFHLGGSVPFPSAAKMGQHCDHALRAIFAWSQAGGVTPATLRLGLVAWLSVLGGAVSLLTITGRNRTLIGPAALLLCSVIAPILAAFVQFFHPQDVLALGLTWLSLSATIRERHVLAGIAMGLAIGANQFALLAAISVVVMLESAPRRRYTFGAAGTLFALYLPFVIASGGRSLMLVAKGSGFNYSTGGTLVWELGLPSTLMFAVSRVIPLIVAFAVSWNFVRRHRTITPIEIVSLASACLALRLVFEANLWGYYFVPLSASLVIVDAMNGRWRGSVIAWLMLEWIAFNPFPYGIDAFGRAWGTPMAITGPVVLTVFGGVMVLHGVTRHQVAWWWVAFFLLAGVSPYVGPHLGHLTEVSWPIWLWQIILVPSGLALLAQPLIVTMSTNTRHQRSLRNRLSILGS